MKPLDDPLDVLVVAPHPDDAELAAGGTIIRCRRAGLRVGILDLTDGEPTPHGSGEIRRRETEAANAILQVAWRHNLGLVNRSLENTLEARRAIASIYRLTRPRLILGPYWDDAHPDHIVANRLVEDARFWAKLSKSDMPAEPYWPPRMLCYWSVHLRVHGKPSFIFDVSDAIDEKMAAVACYQSQFVAGRPTEFPTVLDDIRDRARYWGWSIGKAYGEPFFAREEIGLSDMTPLLG